MYFAPWLLTFQSVIDFCGSVGQTFLVSSWRKFPRSSVFSKPLSWWALLATVIFAMISYNSRPASLLRHRDSGVWEADDGFHETIGTGVSVWGPWSKYKSAQLSSKTFAFTAQWLKIPPKSLILLQCERSELLHLDIDPIKRGENMQFAPKMTPQKGVKIIQMRLFWVIFNQYETALKAKRLFTWHFW